jgi:hypothetical protein
MNGIWVRERSWRLVEYGTCFRGLQNNIVIDFQTVPRRLRKHMEVIINFAWRGWAILYKDSLG